MSARESSSREVRQPEGEGLGRLGAEALAWIAYLLGVCGVLFFGSGGFSVSWIVGSGLVLAVAVCLCWVAAGRITLSIGALVLLVTLFGVGNEPQGTIQMMLDGGLGPTYFGCCRE